MSIQISVFDQAQDKTIGFQVDPNETLVEDLKALVEVEFGIPLAEQVLRFNNQNLLDKEVLKRYNVQNNDVVQVFRRQQQRQQQPQQFGQQNNLIQQQSLQEAQQIKQYYTNNPQQMQYILHQNPQLANAVLNDDISDLVKIITQRKQQDLQKKMQEMQELARLQADPLNPDNQRRIEEIIRKQNIQENLSIAQEYMPENFGQITMLYIEISVQKHPVQAFVDSGAQQTIMSRACAERCGIMRLVDTNFSGMAVGVGTQRILGRIHMIEIQIMDKFFPCSLTILDGDNIDFLLGLDMLRRFRCSIDLRVNQLIFPDQNLHVPFLGEAQIHRQISFEQEKQLYEQQQQKDLQQQTQQAHKEQPVSNNRPQQQAQPQENRQSIETLKSMGFSEQEAKQALRQTGGNVELAASLLTQMKYGF